MVGPLSGATSVLPRIGSTVSGSLTTFCTRRRRRRLEMPRYEFLVTLHCVDSRRAREIQHTIEEELTVGLYEGESVLLVREVPEGEQ